MENCCAGTSMNSVLLLKERIIKVETLLEKYASLARKFNDLEKSHSQIAENERNAKRDAAKYLEKYCRLAKKCFALLSKIKSLEETIKEKANIVAQSENELAKLNSLLQMYNFERTDYLNLKKDKDFLLSLTWKLLKDSGLESKDNKNNKTAENFLKRFERELKDLKLNGLKIRKPKKIVKSEPEEEELKTAFSSSELSVLSSVETDIIDAGAIPESPKSVSQGVDNFDGVVREFIEKPYDSFVVTRQNDVTFVAEADNNRQSDILEIDNLSDSSETCINLATEGSSIDVRDSITKDLSNSSNSVGDGDGFGVGAKDSVCAPIQQKRFSTVEMTKESEMQINETCNDLSAEHSNILQSVDNAKNTDSTTNESSGKTTNPEQFHNSSTPGESPDSKMVVKNRYLRSKQFRGKTITNHPLVIDKSLATITENTNVGTDHIEYSNEIISSDFDRVNESLKNLSNNVCDLNKVVTTEKKIGDKVEESSLLFLEENDSENSGMDVETGNCELEKGCQNSLAASDGGKDEPQKNVSTEEIQENLEFSTGNRGENCSNGDFVQGNCEGDQRDGNSRNEQMKTGTADLKTKSNGEEVEKPPSEEDIPDEEIFGILKNFKAVRLVSPLKERERKECSKRDNPLIKSNRNIGPKVCLINKSNDVEKVQTLNNTPLRPINGCSEKPKMVDESTQTHCVAPPEENKTKREIPEQNAKPEKPSTDPATKSLVQKVVRKILNGKLKNKLKNLDEISKIWKTHPCCILFLKTILKSFGVHCSNHEKCEKETVCNIVRNSLRCKIKKRAVKKRLSTWKVEDATETDAASKKSQYLHNYTGKVNNFVTEDYDSFNKMLSNMCLPPESGRQMELQQFDWYSTQRIDCIRQSDIFGNGLPKSILFQDVALNDLKKENENFRSLPVENYTNKPFFGNDCDMFDMKNVEDVPKPIIDCDSYRVIPPEDGFEEKSEFLADSCSSEAESMDERKCRLVPRRSSRIQDRNNRLRTAVSPKCRSTSSSSSVQQNDESVLSNEVSKNISAVNVETSPGFTQPKNSTVTDPPVESPDCLDKKYELLFGETTSPEPCYGGCNDIEPTKINLSPKYSYNLRRKNVSSEINDNDNSQVVKKPRLSPIKFSSSSKRPSNILGQDLYYSPEEEENKEVGEPQTEPVKTQESGNLLDSIMTAMTKQTEEFKPKVPVKRLEREDTTEVNGAVIIPPSTPQHCSFPSLIPPGPCPTPRSYSNSSDEGSFRMNFSDSWVFDRQSSNESDRNCAEERNSSPGKCQEGSKIKKMVEAELSKFLKGEIKSVEDGEEKLKPCIAVMEKASENVIASVIVAEVLANVDEELQDFDRPAPPLTQTQHRLMTILTILTNSCEKFRKINYIILKTIWAKLFPEKFFWPDDSVEMASRFYSALCKKLNYFKGIWRFCFKAVSSMRQRWCIPIFVVFQVWPDILHNATEIQDNILVKTFVNVILHTPKSESMRRKQQEGKLLAIKHLLINFYNFQVNVTIEELARQLFQSLSCDTPGSAEALVFLSKCRYWTWIRKNIIPPLLENLTNWSSGKVTAECGFKTLEIIHQISSVLPVDDTSASPSAKNVISTLYQILGSSCCNPTNEQKVIRILCSLAHHTGVKDILCALSNKFPGHDPLHVEIKKAISSSDRKRKQLLKNTKNMIKMEAKFKKKQEMKKKKKKKVKKKKKGKVNNLEKNGLEMALT